MTNQSPARAQANAEAVRRLCAASPVVTDVAPALERLRDAGFRLATLTNSPKAAVRTEKSAGSE